MIETYGKASLLRRELFNIKSRFVVSDYSKDLTRSFGLDSYIPALSKVRVALGGAFTIFSFVVPGTFAPITVPMAVRWALK